MSRPRPPRAPRFSSWLAVYLERFVALKRATGAHYHSEVLRLEAFDRFLRDHCPEPPLRHRQLLTYLEELEHLSARGRDNVVSVLWQALGHASMHGAPMTPLPPRPPPAPRWLRNRAPRILTEDELLAMLRAAHQLPPRQGIRPASTATLIALLWCTGMRIGEALALDIGDIDAQDNSLIVRHGKFGKTRVLPLKRTSIDALQGYIEHPRRPVDRHRSSPLFVSLRSHRLSYEAASRGFRDAAQTPALSGTGGRPRPHDLRHSFAVQRVLAWYRQKRDVQSLLPALSTYMGHVSVEHTRCYLQANGLLLEQASRLFERHAFDIDGGRS